MGRVVVVASVLLLAACSDKANTSADRPELEAARAELMQQATTASPLRQEIFSDGFVTDQEAQQTVTAFVECAEDEGLTIEPSKKPVAYSSQHSVKGDGEQEIQTYDQCEQRTYMLVGMMLSIQEALPGDLLEQRNALVARCLIDAGYPAEGWPTINVDVDPSIEARCVDQAYAAIDL